MSINVSAPYGFETNEIKRIGIVPFAFGNLASIDVDLDEGNNEIVSSSSATYTLIFNYSRVIKGAEPSFIVAIYDSNNDRIYTVDGVDSTIGGFEQSRTIVFNPPLVVQPSCILRATRIIGSGTVEISVQSSNQFTLV